MLSTITNDTQITISQFGAVSTILCYEGMAWRKTHGHLADLGRVNNYLYLFGIVWWNISSSFSLAKNGYTAFWLNNMFVSPKYEPWLNQISQCHRSVTKWYNKYAAEVYQNGTNLAITIEWGWVGCEEFCRSRRLLPTEAKRPRWITQRKKGKNEFFVFLLTKNNTTWSPGFLGHRFNNLQRAALLTSLVQYDKVISKFS